MAFLKVITSGWQACLFFGNLKWMFKQNEDISSYFTRQNTLGVSTPSRHFESEEGSRPKFHTARDKALPTYANNNRTTRGNQDEIVPVFDESLLIVIPVRYRVNTPYGSFDLQMVPRIFVLFHKRSKNGRVDAELLPRFRPIVQIS